MYEDSLHIREINDKILQILHNAKKEIRIASPFINMLYEKIIKREQLFDEFNASIQTSDKDAVTKAIKFFDNLYDFEKKGSQQSVESERS